MHHAQQEGRFVAWWKIRAEKSATLEEAGTRRTGNACQGLRLDLFVKNIRFVENLFPRKNKESATTPHELGPTNENTWWSDEITSTKALLLQFW